MPYLDHESKSVFINRCSLTEEQNFLLQEALDYVQNNHSARIKYNLYINKKLEFLSYHVSNEMHRNSYDGPAYYRWNYDGELTDKSYWENDVYHRDPKEGVAYYEVDEEWDIHREEYYWEGVEVDKDFLIPSRRPIPDGLGRVFL